jgi:hypothetical protein
MTSLLYVPIELNKQLLPWLVLWSEVFIIFYPLLDLLLRS